MPYYRLPPTEPNSSSLCLAAPAAGSALLVVAALQRLISCLRSSRRGCGVSSTGYSGSMADDAFMGQPDLDPDKYPPIDPQEPVPDDPGELLPDTPDELPPPPVEPLPDDGDEGGVREPA